MRMHATHGLICLGLSLMGSYFARAVHGAESPNIIVVLVDDMGYSDLGAFGGEVRTPNLDRMAKGGLRFTQTYNSARCCPSRASLLTGLYSHQAGIANFTGRDQSKKLGPAYLGRLNKRCVTLAEVLKTVGYNTYGVPGMVDMPNALVLPDAELGFSLTPRFDRNRRLLLLQPRRQQQ